MKKRASQYIHGSARKEQRRLSTLNAILNRNYLEVVAPRKGERILDLGSGLGQFSAAMAGRGAKVVGVERNPHQLAFALRLRRRSKAPRRLEFRQGDVLSLELGRGEWGSFDLVHTRFLLEHLPDPAAVVRTMARAAKPGGRVFVSDDDHDVFHLTPEPEGFARLWNAYVKSYERLGNDPYVGRELVEMMKDAGLIDVRIGGMFFGACADEEHFGAIADNLIGILEGAGPTILRYKLMAKAPYARAMKALREWRLHPAAAQWYWLAWAEGRTRG